MSLFRVKAALTALRAGRFVVVADDQDRENEGDLILAAESMTAAQLAFMLRHTSGVVCVALTRARCQSLALPLMVPEHNSEPQRTQFTISVDAAVGTTTGISAQERAYTIRSLADPKLGPKAFLRPGHVFPLRARPQGVLERRGHTEAAVDLARLAGFEPAGALCELTAEDGSMLRGAQLERFAEQHDLPFLTIADLVGYRRATEAQPAAAAGDALLEHFLLPRVQA
jgi:3,4-dihydroxy 2-butanone 4-phosphate synthase/GTP cyclohydrolase II